MRLLNPSFILYWLPIKYVHITCQREDVFKFLVPWAIWELKNPSTTAFDIHTSTKKQAVRMCLTIMAIMQAKCSDLHLHSYYVSPRSKGTYIS